MNRPYYAFGALFTLLALTTLAVSSSSRSTTVRREPAPVACSQRLQKRPGGPAFVIVLTEEGRKPAASKIAAAKVELAGPMASLVAVHDPMDCRSQSDTAYDFAVYGALPAIQPLIPLHAEQRNELAAEELVSIFATLSQTSCSERFERPAIFRGWPRQLHTLALGLQNWALSRADHIPLAWLWKQLLADPAATSRPVSWQEYAELIEQAPARAEFTKTAALQPATIHWSTAVPVQSGHWLLHSAASSLNHLALLLETAARQLEQPAAVAANN